MNDTGSAKGMQPPLDVDAIMRQVRAEVARRGVVVPGSGGSELCWRPTATRLPDQPNYALGDFLRFSDADFVDVVYRKLLRRPANDEGSSDYLRALRAGKLDRLDVLAAVRFSEEGVRNGVPVAGLPRHYRIHKWQRIRGVGWLLRMGMAVVRLPRLAMRLQRLEAAAAWESQEIGRLLNRLEAANAQRHVAHAATLAEQGATLAEQGTTLAEQGTTLAEQGTTLADLSGKSRDDQRRLRAMLERLTVFLDVAARQRSHDTVDGAAGAPPPALEAQYASFEDAFRGERAEIKLRVAHYLGTLAAAGIHPGNDGIVLDLGSGRGEWLEVLNEHGYRGRGVDTNRGMLERSMERGHEVVQANAIDYLYAQGDAAFAAITAMHLVEHIPHAALLELLDQALRVLRPGGVLILETPNPENVRVGSYTFYMDPTHHNPIPPLLLQWVVQARGFERVTIERLSEHRGGPALLPVAGEVPGARQINQMVEWFTAPSDYAVVARKVAVAGKP